VASINLSDETLNAVIGQAILGQLTPEGRETILRDAVKSLLEKSPDRYGSGKSRLVDAFDQAAYTVCLGLAREFMATDETVKVEMKRLLSEAWVKMLEDRDDVVRRLASAMSSVFSEK